MNILILAPLAPKELRFGTELVAHGLASHWADLGHDVTISDHVAELAPVPRKEDGIRIVPLPPLPDVSRWAAFHRRHGNIPGFQALIEERKPDVAVLIGFNGNRLNLSHLEVLKEAGCPVVLWHHVPAITCGQKALQYKARELCDGKIRIRRCTACRLVHAGVPEVVAEVASLIPPIGMEIALPRKLDHLVYGTRNTRWFARSVDELRGLVSHVYIGAFWVEDVLARNGFDREKMSVTRPGVRREFLEACRQVTGVGRRSAEEHTLRLAFWGRIDTTKGIETLVLAMQRIEGDISVKIAGAKNPADPFSDYIIQLVSKDPRIELVGQMDTPSLAKLLTGSDVAVIPSTWPETGPLTVFEAHAARLPILGASTGGIAEICAEDPSARLFPGGDDRALAALIQELYDNREELVRRRALVPPPRTMADVAKEMEVSMKSYAGK